MSKTLHKARQSVSLALRIILAALIVAVIIWKYNYLTNLDVRALIDAASTPLLAIATVLGVYLVKSVCFVIPAMMIYISVGMAFPTWEALLINSAGILIEIIVSWAVGRLLGGKAVAKILSGSKKGQKLLSKGNSTKYPAFFVMRLLPAFPIDFVSLFMGTTDMKFVPYVLLSFFGILPRVALSSVIGDKIYQYVQMKYIIPIVLAVIVAVIAVSIIRYIIKMVRGADFEYEPIASSRRNVILDTDLGPDCDDAGALAVLLALLKREDISPLGVVNCTSNEESNAAIRAILDFCGFYNVPVAQTERRDFLEHSSDYVHTVALKYLDGKKPETLDALDFYHDALKNSGDDSVVIVSIGMLNNISDLTEKYPDLVSKKVNALIAMAGRFPEGEEFNITTDIESARKVFETFPRPIICSGFEIGSKIKTGFVKTPANADKNPVYDCYLYHHDAKNKMRESWDLTAVQFAVEGCGDFYKTTQRGRITVDENGRNKFEKDRTANHYYLKLKAKPAKVQEYLQALLDEWNGKSTEQNLPAETD